VKCKINLNGRAKERDGITKHVCLRRWFWNESFQSVGQGLLCGSVRRRYLDAQRQLRWFSYNTPLLLVDDRRHCRTAWTAHDVWYIWQVGSTAKLDKVDCKTTSTDVGNVIRSCSTAIINGNRRHTLGRHLRQAAAFAICSADYRRLAFLRPLLLASSRCRQTIHYDRNNRRIINH